ncbi:MAG TPA: hypothetical protein VEC37_02800, partial [Bacillota bacterium]|nr:hypothetical protein [Bacillota bacterium]
MEQIGQQPQKQGLYDPQFEHDACGIGFVVNINGVKSHDIVRQGLQVLLNLDHRGARGAEQNTGDGAGILVQIPHSYLKRATATLGFQLPAAGEYAVGMVFLPQNASMRADCEKTLGRIVRDEGQILLGWRTVPTDS